MAVLVLFLVITALLVYYLYNRNRYFDRLGIRTPPSWIILGHLQEFATIPFGVRIQQWAKEGYGNLFGIYEGGVPVLVMSDIDMVQDVFVKQYENFHARKEFPLAKNPDTDKYASMFTARGLRWKRIRTLSNPVFKQSNLKRLCPILDQATVDFMQILSEQVDEGNPINIMINFQYYTCDVIARVAFGETKNTQRIGTNPYYDFVKQLFPDKPKFTSNILHLLPMVFPEMKTPISQFFHIYSQLMPKDPWYSLTRQVTALIEQRRRDGPNESPDFIDLFLEVESSGDMAIGDESHLTDIKQTKIEKKILNEEIVGQLLLFLVAGYETTANSLSYVAYHLALNQEVQERVRDEIVSVIGGSTTEITQEMCSQMRYTEQCLKEVLRLYPLASFVQSRTCMKSTIVGKERQMKIPEGLVVLLDAWTIQHGRLFWGADASEFRPERFDEVNADEIAKHWMPFGIGPRTCIGMRFSILEQKILLANILQKYRIIPCKDTKIPIQLRGAVTVVATDVTVKLDPI